MFKVPYEQVPTYDRDGEGSLPSAMWQNGVATDSTTAWHQTSSPLSLALSPVEAEQAYRLYHMASPEVSVWWDDLVALVRRDRAITTMPRTTMDADGAVG